MAEGKSIYGLSSELSYDFSDITLLKTALTHISYTNENKNCDNYERLEFLGDAVLQIVISDYLYSIYTDADEGCLTDYRKHIVCNASLYEAALRLKLGEYLILGNGEEKKCGRSNKSILSKVMEAIIGAIYLDCEKNLVKVSEIIIPIMQNEIDNCRTERDGDYISLLQRLVEQDGKEKLGYTVTKTKNSDNETVFVANAMLNSNVIGTGIGKNTHDAEILAAKQALFLFGYSENDES